MLSGDVSCLYFSYWAAELEKEKEWQETQAAAHTDALYEGQVLDYWNLSIHLSESVVKWVYRKLSEVHLRYGMHNYLHAC